MSLVEISGLSLSIGAAQILREVSLEVDPGQVVGLVGESGSGKSLTALALIGLLPEAARVSGSARFDGREMTTLSEAELCRIRGAEIGVIFQEPMTALNPLQTIGAQIIETLRLHRRMPRAEAEAIARERLARVGLPEGRFPLSLYPHELSGGQRQRVAIAMAIALRPKLLIADEPTTALDVTTQAQILDLLDDLVDDEGMALLLITHDLAVVAGRCDRVAVMKAGEVVAEGPTEPLFRARAHPYTRALFEASDHVPTRTPGHSGRPLLEVSEVVRDYPLPRRSLFAPRESLRAVDHVSFTLHAGESLGLVGESGCGKSTLTRAILGLEPVQEGTIRLQGQPVTPQMPKALRADIQVVFQDPFGSFNPRWKVGDLVAEPFFLLDRPPPDADDRVAEALREVGLLPEDREKYIHEFSGGQRQRLAIARALITRPDLIVLDEAVSALDVRVRAQVLDLLARLQESHGLAYLFISHDLTVVRAITDRVLIMDKGRIVEEGPTAQVFDSPQSETARRLIAAAPAIPEAWR